METYIVANIGYEQDKISDQYIKYWGRWMTKSYNLNLNQLKLFQIKIIPSDPNNLIALKDINSKSR